MITTYNRAVYTRENKRYKIYVHRLFNPLLDQAAAYPGRGVLYWAYPSRGLPLDVKVLV